MSFTTTEDNTAVTIKAMETAAYRGLRQWHDARWKTCKLGRSIGFFEKKKKKYIETSRKGRELMDDPMEVGLIDSTRRMGKPFTWGSDQQLYARLRESMHNTQRSENVCE